MTGKWTAHVLCQVNTTKPFTYRDFAAAPKKGDSRDAL